ncbi:hypothetical protein [Salinispora cortesiana]|uniref:hypothetical protein n=1 Tax=Salinispora cortesiana TaxID=1305843 RepID=UPI0004718C18|nr:hypothetical protein [Salinispora cortesiana]
MLIDCDGCAGRVDGCSGCLVTALLEEPVAFGAAEARAIEVFARAGFDVQVLPEPRPPVRRPGRHHRVA